MGLRFRSWGHAGPALAVIHGGPGAPGYMAPVAKELARDFRVLEPFQRPSGGEPLTVARHVEDLREFLAERFPGERPALVGSSWGAMLALCFAAEHPGAPGPVVMVGSGTFDPAARARYKAILASRIDAAVQARLDAVDREEPDPDRRLGRRADVLMRPGRFGINAVTYPAMLAAGCPLFGYRFDGYWRVLDTHAGLAEGRWDLARSDVLAPTRRP